ncbi:MAG: hypothetical protein FWC60_09440 [Firmicutes bacterium]|nr:hypothetical protein [Bacillota bacterium]
MAKISLILSGVIFILGCITLCIGIIFSDVLPKLFEIYLTAHPVSYSFDIYKVNSFNLYLLSFGEMALGILGYLFHRKKA